MPSTTMLEDLIARFRERAKHAEEDGKTLLAQDFTVAAQVAEELIKLRASLRVVAPAGAHRDQDQRVVEPGGSDRAR